MLFGIKFQNLFKMYFIKYCFVLFLHLSVPYFCYIKVKFSLEQAMKAQRGSRGIALLFL
jgi:hypothetical protein